MKTRLFAACTLLALAFSADAQFVNSKPGQMAEGTVSTVRAAKTEYGDDAHIVLEGYITGSAGTLNPEEYFFKDDTDSIKVEINPDVWRGQKVSPDTRVRIAGEVDVNPLTKTVEIEVRRLDIVAANPAT